MKVDQHVSAPDRQHVALLDQTTFQPIFIMGDHRSGTTLLYRLLDATDCFNVVRAYHIIRYDEVLANYLDGKQEAAKQRLGDFFQSAGVTDRMIDGVQVTPDLPEEYGFLLSPAYKAPLQPSNLPTFVELCRKVQYVSNQDRPLLLKNPWDYFLNFLYVKEAFPRAKFIFIHRHPIHVINSQLHAVRTGLRIRNPYLALMSRWYARMFDRPAQRIVATMLFSSQLGLRITCRHVVRATQYVMQHTDMLPAADVMSLKYEDLCADPDGSVGAILTFLGLEAKTPISLRSLIAPRSLPQSPEISEKHARLRRQMQPFFERYGYV